MAAFQRVVLGIAAASSRSLPRAVPFSSSSRAAAISRSVSATEMQPDVPPPANTPEKIKIALCQTASTPNKAANIAAATAAIKEAASLGADVVVLPEMWHCPYGNDSFPVYAEDVEAGESESARALSEAAASCGVAVVGGSISEKESKSTSGGGPDASDKPPPRLFNTCLVFGPDGSLLAKHRKAHLFDIDIPGKIAFLESETLTPGASATTVDVPCPKRRKNDSSSSSSTAPPPVVRLGIGICYDLRFPEYAAVLSRRGAQVLIYPGAFNTTTGPAHWELLARARAVDAQAFVALCSPARISEQQAEEEAKRNKDGKKPYVAHGHSLVSDPWGLVAVDAGASAVGVFSAELDLTEVGTRRRNMPLASQRRGDLYELVDKGR